MASTVTLAAALPLPLPPPTQKQVFPSKGPDVRNVEYAIRVARRQDLQVRHKIEQGELRRTTTRRDAIFCLCATLLTTMAGGGGSAEARTVMKPETRRKIWEKLDKIREKAGVPKEKLDLQPDEDKAAETRPQAQMESAVPKIDEKPEDTETSPQND